MGKRSSWSKLRQLQPPQILKRVVKEARGTLQLDARAQRALAPRQLKLILNDLSADDAAAALKRASTRQNLESTYQPLQEVTSALTALRDWMNEPLDESLCLSAEQAGSAQSTGQHSFTTQHNFPDLPLIIDSADFSVPTIDHFTGKSKPKADISNTIQQLQDQLNQQLIVGNHDGIQVILAGTSAQLHHGLVSLAAIRASRQQNLASIIDIQVNPESFLNQSRIIGQVQRRALSVALVEATAIIVQAKNFAQTLLDAGIGVTALWNQHHESWATKLTQPILHSDAERVAQRHTKRTKAVETKNLKEFLATGELTLQAHKPVALALPPGFHEDPHNDNNWRFNLHSLRWADPLRQSYIATGDENYKLQHLAILKRWIRSRGDSTNAFIPLQIWTDMCAALRTRNLIAAAATYGPDPELMASLRHHLTWLKNPENWPSRGNHLLHVYRGMLDAAVALGDEATRSAATTLIFDYIRDSVTLEGEDLEGAYMYQRLNQTWAQEALDDVRVSNKIPADVEQRVTNMANLSLYCRDYGGHATQYGDSNAVTGKPVRLGQKLPAPTPQHETIQPLQIYQQAGVAFLRAEPNNNPDQGTFAMLRVYPENTQQIHGHNDHGQVLISFGKHQILKDSGRHTYGGGERSHYLKSVLAHSVAAASDAAVQDELVKGHYTWSSSGEGFQAASCSAKIDGDTTWHRSVVVHSSGEVDVYDYWESSTQKNFQQFWQVADFSFENQSVRGWQLCKDGVPTVDVSVNIPVNNLALQRGQTQPFAGFRSDKYKEFIPATRINVKDLPSNTIIRTRFSIQT